MENRRAARLSFGAVVALGIGLFATNIRGVTLNRLAHPLVLGTLDVALEIIVAGLALSALLRLGRLRDLGSLLVRVWPLTLFVLLGLASTLWSVNPVATVIRLIILFCSTIMAAYLAARFSLIELLRLAAAGFLALGGLSLFVALVFPAAGTQLGLPYYGAWCGVFWNRNYLGSTMALGSVILLLAGWLTWSQGRVRAGVYFGGYVLSIALVVLSRSATGMIIALALHALTALIAAWQHLRNRLRAVHYWVFAAILFVVGAVGVLNLDRVLGVFNRNSTFTGRVGLWRYLLENVVARRPWLGHGLGTLWTEPAFQTAVRDGVGWPFPVVIGDSGYVDILLQLGIAGLMLLLVALVWALVRSATLLKGQGMIFAVPLIVLAYLLITNYTLSYFLETESFTWIVAWAFVFGADRAQPMPAAGRELRSEGSSVTRRA